MANGHVWTAGNAKESGSGVRPSTLRLRPNPDVVAHRLAADGVIVLFHLGTDRFYQLNRTAARLWELLVGAGSDVARLQAEMLREFDVDGAELSAEIDSIVTSMANEDLVGIHPGE